jgi:hypothetical protein
MSRPAQACARIRPRVMPARGSFSPLGRGSRICRSRDAGLSPGWSRKKFGSRPPSAKSGKGNAMLDYDTLPDGDSTKPTEEVRAKLPLEIAKAMKLIVCGKASDGRPSLQQVLCESYHHHWVTGDTGYPETAVARYVGTNGHVMLIVDTTLPPPTESQVFSGMKKMNAETGTNDPSDVELIIASKGYYEPEYFRAADSPYTFPDYKAVIPQKTEAIDKIGFDVSYMDMILKIHRALGLQKGREQWSVSFDGNLGPTTWAPQHVDGSIVSVRFIVMPVRLSN